MKNKSGEDLIAFAASLSVGLACDADIEELCVLIELLGLIKHNLEIIKSRRVLRKIEKKIGEKEKD